MKERTNELFGFIFFCIFGDRRNPANEIASLLGKRPVRVSPQKARVARALIKGAEMTPCSDKGLLQDLLEWATVESMSMGSHQRTMCPLDKESGHQSDGVWIVPRRGSGEEPPRASEALRGSGRWGANDSGGDYAALMRLLLQWEEDGSSDWTRLGRVLGLDPLRHLEVAKTKWAIQVPGTPGYLSGRLDDWSIIQSHISSRGSYLLPEENPLPEEGGEEVVLSFEQKLKKGTIFEVSSSDGLQRLTEDAPDDCPENIREWLGFNPPVEGIFFSRNLREDQILIEMKIDEDWYKMEDKAE